jgi:2-oxoisovalerate dehydrogenase E1 component alpha subunit
MYTDMIILQTMDTLFYEAQRQGRISFYLTTIGEEAINIATAAALTIDDCVFPQVTSTYSQTCTSLTIL